MKVNVGCGPYIVRPPWINVDRNTSLYPADFSGGGGETKPRAPDVVAPSWALPFEDGSVDQLYCGHLFEHLSLIGNDSELLRTIAEFRRVLAPNGSMCVVTPDVIVAAEMIYRGQAAWPDFWASHGTAGRGNPNGPAYEGDQGDVHRWSSSREALYLLLRLSFPEARVTLKQPTEIENEWPIVSLIVYQAVVLVERNAHA